MSFNHFNVIFGTCVSADTHRFHGPFLNYYFGWILTKFHRYPIVIISREGSGVFPEVELFNNHSPEFGEVDKPDRDLCYPQLSWC